MVLTIIDVLMSRSDLSIAYLTVVYLEDEGIGDEPGTLLLHGHLHTPHNHTATYSTVLVQLQ